MLIPVVLARKGGGTLQQCLAGSWAVGALQPMALGFGKGEGWCFLWLRCLAELAPTYSKAFLPVMCQGSQPNSVA